MPDVREPFQLIDLVHLGRSGSVAACLVPTPAGPLVIDPGPAVTLPRLEAGLAAAGYELRALHAILVTHIHLDHAGAAGTLARANPRLQVFVHEIGAKHLADPTKLLRSASRLYGERMAELWGDVLPVPAEQLRPLAGGETPAFGGRRIDVAYTPGHAAHHVSFFEPEHRIAFVGDTAGIRDAPLPIALPVTPPPEFDLTLWLESLKRIAAWRPATLFITHFGPWRDPEEHLEQLRAGLVAWTDAVQRTLDDYESDDERIRGFIAAITTWLDGRVPAEQAAGFLAGAGPEACWRGIARYLGRLDGRTPGR